MTGRIHSVQTMGTLDGPGVRLVIFMQGCPLRCAYCHNPDTWELSGGLEIDLDSLKNKILRYRNYFGGDGGVTVSGGEPLLQAEFVRQIFSFCRENDIHTALDTSGCFLNDGVKNLLEYTDLCLLDFKFANSEDYSRYTGGSFESTMNFLKELDLRKIPVWLRSVIVQGVNDSQQMIGKIMELKRDFSCIEKVELLPFRKICMEKYEELGIEFPFKDLEETSNEYVKILNENINNQKENGQ